MKNAQPKGCAYNFFSGSIEKNQPHPQTDTPAVQPAAATLDAWFVQFPLNLCTFAITAGHSACACVFPLNAVLAQISPALLPHTETPAVQPAAATLDA